jgi:hypothetical protein
MKPDSNLKVFWDFIANAALIMSMFLSSYIISFDMMTYESLYTWELVIDLIVFLDVVLYFFTSFEDIS